MAVLPRPVYQAIGNVLTHPRFHPIHRWLYRWTGGRGPLSRALGMDMILVVMRGRKSGAERVVPLGAVRRGDDWILIASNAGKQRMPAWAYNLRADGTVTVEHRGMTRPFRAHEATGEEFERLWRVVTAAYPGYQVYQDRTDRAIPLFVLEPAPETAAGEA